MGDEAGKILVHLFPCYLFLIRIFSIDWFFVIFGRRLWFIWPVNMLSLEKYTLYQMGLFFAPSVNWERCRLLQALILPLLESFSINQSKSSRVLLSSDGPFCP
ncbi:hypothetical protein FCM35_KLT00509 [Carex littledalei]|uniref:Uncharacterized protein n=1 Tax=Carex littledalei TaxID=544730 RepID=A0A833RU73_9POAL|nr:hypothetical protein FCM35_KLT00509 [Carex littledalei]